MHPSTPNTNVIGMLIAWFSVWCPFGFWYNLNRFRKYVFLDYITVFLPNPGMFCNKKENTPPPGESPSISTFARIIFSRYLVNDWLFQPSYLQRTALRCLRVVRYLFWPMYFWPTSSPASILLHGPRRARYVPRGESLISSASTWSITDYFILQVLIKS